MCDLTNFFSKENNDRKRNLDEINDWIKAENEKRMAEAEALRARYYHSIFHNRGLLLFFPTDSKP